MIRIYIHNAIDLSALLYSTLLCLTSATHHLLHLLATAKEHRIRSLTRYQFPPSTYTRTDIGNPSCALMRAFRLLYIGLLSTRARALLFATSDSIPDCESLVDLYSQTARRGESRREAKIDRDEHLEIVMFEQG